jgi:hypothetical protein
MNTQHTPGPWRVKSSNPSGTLEIVGGEQYHHVCKLDGKRQESHFHAQQANAKLIAAAPELLAALQEAERVIRFAAQEAEGRIKREIVGGWKHHADLAREVINKATK